MHQRDTMRIMEIVWTKAAIDAAADKPGLAKRVNIAQLVFE